MYAIKVTRNFFGPRTAKGYLTDAAGDRATFSARADADATIEMMDSGAYHLDHNEYSRPEYKVVRVKA